jgi:hypothetical protein
VLRNEAAGTSRPGAGARLGVVLQAEHHDRAARHRGADRLRHGDPVHPLKMDIHQHDIRAGFGDRLEGALSVGSLTDDLDVRLDAQAEPETCADDCFVIDQKETDELCHGCIVDVFRCARIGRVMVSAGLFVVI